MINKTTPPSIIFKCKQLNCWKTTSTNSGTYFLSQRGPDPLFSLDIWRSYAGEVYSLNIRQWTRSIDLLNPIFFLDMMVASKGKMIMFGGVDDIENNIPTSVGFTAFVSISKKNCWKPPYAGRGLSLLSHYRDVWSHVSWGDLRTISSSQQSVCPLLMLQGGYISAVCVSQSDGV